MRQGVHVTPNLHAATTAKVFSGAKPSETSAWRLGIPTKSAWSLSRKSMSVLVVQLHAQRQQRNSHEFCKVARFRVPTPRPAPIPLASRAQQAPPSPSTIHRPTPQHPPTESPRPRASELHVTCVNDGKASSSALLLRRRALNVRFRSASDGDWRGSALRITVGHHGGNIICPELRPCSGFDVHDGGLSVASLL